MEFESIPHGLRYTRHFKTVPETIRIEATNITMERGRPHAQVALIFDTRLLAFDYLSLSRSEERIRLSNRAHGMLAENLLLVTEYAKEFLQHELDLFCRDLYDKWMSSAVPEPMAGDASPSPLPYLVDPYVVQDGGSLLYGPPGAGKSWLLMLMLVSVDAGLQWPWKTQQTTVLFTNIERSEASVKRRLGLVNTALRLPPERPLLTLNQRGKSLRDIADTIKRTVTTNNVGLHGLDSVSRAGFGDLTADKSANAITDMLNDLSPSWLALAHSPRQDSGHVFGSIHFDAGADVVVRLASEQREMTLGVSMTVDKVNDGVRGARQLVALDFLKDTGLHAVRLANTREFVELELGDRAIPLVERIVIELEEMDRLTASQLSVNLNHDRSYIAKLLNSSNLFESIREGREVFYHLKNDSRIGPESEPEKEQHDESDLLAF